MGPICRGGGFQPAGDCEGRRASIKADLAAKQWNDQFIGQQLCKAKIEGEIVLAEPGKYHLIDNEVFYVAKIKAEGLYGVAESGGCASKKDIIPLTGYICLKWTNTAGSAGWQSSSKQTFDRLSLESNQRIKAQKKEEWEKEKYERWQKSGEEETKRRMQSNTKFQPLIPNVPLN